MKRKRIATARFTAQTHAHGPTEERVISAGTRLVFLHLSDDGVSTFFALEDEEPQWTVEGDKKRPLEYIVATEAFDACTRGAE
jgi:hypothetical protein